MEPAYQPDNIQLPPVEPPTQTPKQEPSSFVAQNGYSMEAFTAQRQSERYNNVLNKMANLGMIKPTTEEMYPEGLVEGSATRLVKGAGKETVDIIKGIFDVSQYDQQASSIMKQKLYEYENATNEADKRRIEMEMFEAMTPLNDDIVARGARHINNLTVTGVQESILGIWRTLKRAYKLVAYPAQTMVGSRTFEQNKRDWFYLMEHPVTTTLDALVTAGAAKGIKGLVTKERPAAAAEPARTTETVKPAQENINRPNINLEDIPIAKYADIEKKIQLLQEQGKLPKEYYEGGMFKYDKYTDRLSYEAIAKTDLIKPRPDFIEQAVPKMFEKTINDLREKIKTMPAEVTGKKFLEKSKNLIKKKQELTKELESISKELETKPSAELARVKTQKEIALNTLNTTIEAARRGTKAFPYSEMKKGQQQSMRELQQVLREREQFINEGIVTERMKKEVMEEWDKAIYNEINSKIGTTAKVRKTDIQLPEELRTDIQNKAKLFMEGRLPESAEAAKVATQSSIDMLETPARNAADRASSIEDLANRAKIVEQAPEPAGTLFSKKPDIKSGEGKGPQPVESQAPIDIKKFADEIDQKEFNLDILKRITDSPDLPAYIDKNLNSKMAHIPFELFDFRNMIDMLKEMGIPEIAKIVNETWSMRERAKIDLLKSTENIEMLFEKNKISKEKFWDDYEKGRENWSVPEKMIVKEIEGITETFASLFDLKEKGKYRTGYLPHVILKDIVDRLKKGGEAALTGDQNIFKEKLFGESFDPFLLARSENLPFIKDPTRALNVYIEAGLSKLFNDFDKNLFGAIENSAKNKATNARHWLQRINEEKTVREKARLQKKIDIEKAEEIGAPTEYLKKEVELLQKQLEQLAEKEAADPSLDFTGWDYTSRIIREHVENISNTQKASDRAFLQALNTKAPFSIAFLWAMLKNPLVPKKIKIRDVQLKKLNEAAGKGRNTYKFEAEIYNDTSKQWERKTMTPQEAIGKTPITSAISDIKSLNYAATLGLNFQNLVLQTTQILTMAAIMPSHLGIIPHYKSVGAMAKGLATTLYSIFDPKLRAQYKRQGIFTSLDKIIEGDLNKTTTEASWNRKAFNNLIEFTMMNVKAGEYFTRVWAYEMSKNILKATGKEHMSLYEINKVSSEMSRLANQFFSPIHSERALRSNMGKVLYHLGGFTIKQAKLLYDFGVKNKKDLNNPYLKRFLQITREGGDASGFINKLNNSNRMIVVRYALYTFAVTALIKELLDISMFQIMANKQIVYDPTKNPLVKLPFEMAKNIANGDIEGVIKEMQRSVLPASVFIRRLGRAVENDEIKWLFFSEPAIKNKETNY